MIFPKNYNKTMGKNTPTTSRASINCSKKDISSISSFSPKQTTVSQKGINTRSNTEHTNKKKPRMISKALKAIAVAFGSGYLFAIWKFIQTTYRILFGHNYQISIPALWILFDVIFITYMKIRFEFMTRSTRHLPQATIIELYQIHSELFNPLSVPDPKEFFQSWFKGLNFNEISKTDTMEFVSGLNFNRKVDKLTLDQLNICVGYLAKLEQSLGCEFSTSEQIHPFTSLTQDPVEMMYRPWIFYGITNGIDIVVRVVLHSKNFVRTDYGHIISYIREGTSEELPIVFFHGLGFGIALYLSFLTKLISKFPDRTFIFFEMPSITMRAKVSYSLPKKYAGSVATICSDLKITKIFVISHSFGTIVSRWLDKYYLSLIDHQIFVDPVCFSLWTGVTMNNFLYRKPVLAHHYVFSHILAREPGTQLYLRRYFAWIQNTYFTPQLPKNSTIFLPEIDEIVDCRYVATYLSNNPDESRSVIVMKRHKHMQKLLSGKYEDIFDVIGQQVNSSNL
jgi:pimeloyl-ACP methyl ester carboxylesterase